MKIERVNRQKTNKQYFGAKFAKNVFPQIQEHFVKHGMPKDDAGKATKALNGMFAISGRLLPNGMIDATEKDLLQFTTYKHKKIISPLNQLDKIKLLGEDVSSISKNPNENPQPIKFGTEDGRVLIVNTYKTILAELSDLLTQNGIKDSKNRFYSYYKSFVSGTSKSNV